MIGLLQADWRKLRHRWMPRILLLILIALVALIFLGIASRQRFRGDVALPNGFIVALGLASVFAPFIWPVLGGSWAGGEYGWGAIRISLTRVPGRMLFSLSGLLVVLMTVGFGLLLVLGVGAVEGSIVGAANNTSAFAGPPGANATLIIVKLFFAAWYVSAFYAILAYTAGTLFRSVPAGVGIGIGFSVAQSATLAIFTGLGDPWKTIATHFPDGYAGDLTSRLANELIVRGPFSRGSGSSASIPEAVIGLAVYIAILVAAMLLLVRQRDVSV